MTRDGAISGPAVLSQVFAASAASVLRRRRKRRAPFSLRLTEQERERLEKEAGETPLATYIKFRLFNNLPELATFRRGPKRPTSDTQLIAKLLAALGEARLANNLNQLAKAANIGILDVRPETEQELLSACEEVHAMRRDLIAALGLKSDGRS